ncbi:universal stress protein [Lapillicoccus sp.]|uniref:universal stress protein n=1 Tax=Lapillicoccus sp. TaxID=1909287 RepID=UPI0025EAC2CB|nr:universal stress protein [Lapillicoccus sp.]
MSPTRQLPAAAVTVPHPADVRPVVVGVDGSQASDRALDWAIDEAQRRGLPLQLLHAREVLAYSASVLPVDPVGWDDPQWVLQAAHARVTALAPEQVLAEKDVLGTPASTALITASSRADTIVVGARKHGNLGAALLGSTSLRVASHAACPVVVIRDLPPVTGSTPRIVVGVDGSPTSDDALAYAFDRADAQGLPLTVVHAWPGDLTVEIMRVTEAIADEVRAAAANAQIAAIQAQIAPWRLRFPQVPVQVLVPAGDPQQALVEESATATLVVVGSRGLGSVRGMFLGSISEAVLHHAHCPVAVVRPTGPGD